LRNYLIADRKPSNMASEIQIKEASVNLDKHVAEMMQWHFSEDTGCPFWLNWAK